MFDKVKDILAEIQSANPNTAEEIEQFRIKYLGSKNILKPLMSNQKSCGRKAFRTSVRSK